MEFSKGGRANGWDLLSKAHKERASTAHDWGMAETTSRSTHLPPFIDRAIGSTVTRSSVRRGRNQSPRKWRNVHGAYRDQAQKRQLPPDLFQGRTDNVGQHSWRNREAPKDVIHIPEALVQQTPSRRSYTHEEIARQHNVFVFNVHGDSVEGQKVFGIWGNDSDVSATKRDISAWIEASMRATKSHLARKFVKVGSFTPEERTRAEEVWRKDLKRQRFQQYPPPDKAFEAIGSFHWPIEEYRPADILGKSYEALDPVRMDLSSYVVFLPDKAVFQVMGKQENVLEALLRLRRTCFQIAARQVAPVRTYLLHWPADDSVPSQVQLKSYDYPAVISGHQGASSTLSNWPRAAGETEYRSLLETQTGVGELQLCQSVLKMLAKMKYYRGFIQMRIHLGSFLASQFMPPSSGLYKLEDFENMLQETQFEGTVTQELGDLEVEDGALAALQHSEGLLFPLEATAGNLKDVQPVHSAVFTLTDNAGDLRLTVRWHENDNGEPNSSELQQDPPTWSRLERDTGEASSLVDVSLADLYTGTAWRFGLYATQAIDTPRLPKQYIEFARSVKIDAAVARRPASGKMFVRYSPYTVGLKSVQQRTTYRYGISSAISPTDYTLELTCFQYCKYTSGGLTVYEPRWGLSVYRATWDTMFAQNERLPIGEGTTWEHDVDTWFRDDNAARSGIEKTGAGFVQLMEKLQRIATVVRGENLEQLMGGMTVG